MKQLTGWASIIFACGFFIISASFALQQVAPLVSESDCVINVIKSTETPPGSGVEACKNKFNDEPPKISLSEENLGVLDGRASFSNGQLSMNLHNGSSKKITKLQIAIMDPSTEDRENPIFHYYDVHVNIQPYSSKRTRVDVFQEYDQVNWSIVQGWWSF